MRIMGMTVLAQRTIRPVLELLAGLALCVSAEWCVAEERPKPETTPVLEVQDLFQSVRIPNIVVAADGAGFSATQGGGTFR